MTAEVHKESNNMLEKDMVIEIRKQSFLSRLGRVFIKLLRVVLILAIIAGVVTAFYYGVPYFYQKVILPIENNTARLSGIEKAQSTDVEQLTSQINDLQSRLSALETRQTVNAQAITELSGQIEALETAITTHTKSLDQLEAMQIQLESLTNSTIRQTALLSDLRTSILISRSIEMLSRARLYLSQSNYGMAKLDVMAARDLLKAFQEQNLTSKSATMQSVLTQLELALDNLPDFPVVATYNVDIAWQLLVDSWPEQMETAPAADNNAATPTSGADVTPTVTPGP